MTAELASSWLPSLFRHRSQGLRAAESPGMAAGWLVALSVLTPILTLGWLAVTGQQGQWSHLLAHVLPHAGWNTLLLLTGVGTLVLLVGAGCAWLVSAFSFPGRHILAWALLLPLAMPTYIVAFAYLDLLHPIGPVQTLLRGVLGYDSPRDWRLPDLRSMGGAIVLLSFVLYPYVYMTARMMFLSQPAHLMEAARSLGEGHWGVFRRVALPLARPALAVGLALALLETLNDIGASEFLGVNTLTVTIYTTWVTRSDLGGAAQIALSLLLLVVALIWLEQRGRKQQRFATVQRMRGLTPQPLSGARAWLATWLISLPVLVGFAVPTAYLGVLAVERLAQGHGPSAALLDGLLNTIGLALAVTVCVTALGTWVAWTARHGARWQNRLASLGYAVPGTVLAIGVLPPVLALDAGLAGFFDVPGLPLMSCGAVLVAACTLRFLAMSVGSAEAGLMRLPAALEQAARLLGERPLGVLRRVHAPLLRPAIVTGALLVFVDAMKELPATLLLRPANVETLSTLIYGEAARGAYEEGALAALAIVLAGLLPVALLAVKGNNRQPETA